MHIRPVPWQSHGSAELLPLATQVYNEIFVDGGRFVPVAHRAGHGEVVRHAGGRGEVEVGEG